MVPLQRCIRRRGGGYVTALKGISIPIINQSLLRRSRFTPVFMAGEKAATPGSRLGLLPPTVSQLKDTGRRLPLQQRPPPTNPE